MSAFSVSKQSDQTNIIVKLSFFVPKIYLVVFTILNILYQCVLTIAGYKKVVFQSILAFI